MHDGSPVRDEEFWFDDGTIVLVAGDIEFKVYARPLVGHSLVFKDILSLPQPEATHRMPLHPLLWSTYQISLETSDMSSRF